jgi:hypothetical protein
VGEPLREMGHGGPIARADCPWHDRLSASGVLLALWLVELDETAQILVGRPSKRR